MSLSVSVKFDVECHKDAIQEIFNTFFKSNNLLDAGKEDIIYKIFLAEVLAIGITDKLPTGSLW